MAQTQIQTALDDGCESYDDDLGWILEKLTDRAGGEFGLIFRFIDEVHGPTLMARRDGESALPENMIGQIAEVLRGVCRNSFRQEADDPVSSTEIQIESGNLPRGGKPIRVLHMAFRPAAGITIIAAVGRPSTSALLLQGLVAGRLYPVLARYIRLWWMHRTERRRARTFESAMDETEPGLILLDQRAQVAYENAYARRILDSADGLQRAGKSIAPTDPADALRLQAAIQHALQGNLAAELNVAWPAPLVLIRRGEGKRALILTTVALRRRAVDPDDAAAIVQVLHPERDMCKSLAPVCRIYGLTPAEARLAVELVHGSSLLQIAEEMKISIATARSQLKHVFEKTGTNRQAELIRLMLASAVRQTSLNITLT